MRKKIMLVGVTLFVCFSVLTSLSQAADWYTVSVQGIVNKANGRVQLNILPGAGETGFTGAARVLLVESSGTNRMLATILAAMTSSAGAEIDIWTDAPPANPQPFEEVNSVRYAP